MARRISWVGAARKAFEAFPAAVQERMATALRAAARGRTAGIAKPMKGLGGGVVEIAVAYRGNAYRAIYGLQVDEELWVVHAFQKKSKRGVETPRKEVDLIRSRVAALRRTKP